MSSFPRCARALALWLSWFSLGAGGCYLSHERSEVLPDCEGVEVWRYEDRGAVFRNAIAVGSRRHVFGVVAGDGHGLWTFGTDGGVQREGPIGESRSGAFLTVDGGFLVAGQRGRTWRLDRFDESGAALSGVELAIEGEVGVTVLVPAADADAVFAVGTVRTPRDLTEVFVVRANSDGIAWSRAYASEPDAEDRPIGAFLDGEGRLVVLAQRWRSGGGGPFWIFGLDSDGEVAWERLSDVAFERDSTWAFVPVDDGVLLVGNPDGEPGARGPARAMRLDRRGTTRWQIELDVDDSANQSIVNDVIFHDGQFVLVGYSAERTTGMVWGLDTDGSVAFERSPAPSETTGFTAIERLGDGYLIAGDRQWSGVTHLLFVRTDTEGRARWMLEPPYEGWAQGPMALVGTRDGEGALAVGMAFPVGDRERARLALEIVERCE